MLATVVTAVVLLVQSAQGERVQIRAACVDQIGNEATCPAPPQFWLSRQRDGVYTAAPFKAKGLTVTFSRQRGYRYALTVSEPGLASPYAIMLVDGTPYHFGDLR